MKRFNRFLHLQYFAVVILLTPLLLPWFVSAETASKSSPQWTNPAAMSLQAIDQPSTPQHPEPAFVENLSCEFASFTLASNGQEQSDCFTEMAFGHVDTENYFIEFTGGEDALMSVTPYTAGQTLVPWPHTNTVLALDPVPTGGVRVSMYTYFTGVLGDLININGRIVGKRVQTSPNIVLTDSSGQPLVVNPNTLAFSGRGSWLVAETMTGTFTRINLATLHTLSFAPSFSSTGNAPSLNESQLTVSDNGQYVAIANTTAESFRVYDLGDCSSATTCNSYEYWPFVRGQLSGPMRISHIRFLNPGLLDFKVTSGGKRSTYALAPRAGIYSLLDYLALGDSYTSGEGAGEYDSRTDTTLNRCHLSSLAYPALIAKTKYSFEGARSVACSGANTEDIFPKDADNYMGQASDGLPASTRSADVSNAYLDSFTPGFLPQSSFVGAYQPAVITTGIAGNDVGFADIIARCVMPRVSSHPTAANTCYYSYEDRFELAKRIDQELPILVATYRQLHDAAPLSRVYAIGYPQIITQGDCALNVHLNSSEISLAIQLTQHINAVIKGAAERSGATYVDISDALAGHRLCEASTDELAVHGLTAGHDTGLTVKVSGIKYGYDFLSSGSYHPNAYGQQLIELSVMRQTNGLQTTLAQASLYTPATADASFLASPKVGRPINTLVFHAIGPRIATKNQVYRIQYDGVSSGVRPGSTYTLSLDGIVVTTLTATSDGQLNGAVNLPSGVGQGTHTIDITGLNQTGSTTDVRQTVFVAESSDDADGDGLQDVIDACPIAVNSGVDADSDGIDDTCDDLIQAVSANPELGHVEPSNVSSSSTKPSSLMESRQISTLSVASVEIKQSPFGAASQRSAVLGANTQNPQIQTTAARLITPVTTSDVKLAGLLHIHWLRLTLGLIGILIVRSILRRFSEHIQDSAFRPKHH